MPLQAFNSVVIVNQPPCQPSRQLPIVEDRFWPTRVSLLRNQCARPMAVVAAEDHL